VVAVVQKGYDSESLEPYAGRLSVEILKNGEVVKSGSTSAEFGVVTVSYAC
jgi:hypothetical protein